MISVHRNRSKINLIEAFVVIQNNSAFYHVTDVKLITKTTIGTLLTNSSQTGLAVDQSFVWNFLSRIQEE